MNWAGLSPLLKQQQEAETSTSRVQHEWAESVNSPSVHVPHAHSMGMLRYWPGCCIINSEHIRHTISHSWGFLNLWDLLLGEGSQWPMIGDSLLSLQTHASLRTFSFSAGDLGDTWIYSWRPGSHLDPAFPLIIKTYIMFLFPNSYAYTNNIISSNRNYKLNIKEIWLSKLSINSLQMTLTCPPKKG